MLVFFVAIKVIVIALAIGFGLAILIHVPLFIYGIPYCLWVGSQNCKGKHKDKKNESTWRTARNATILYKSWILRKEPRF